MSTPPHLERLNPEQYAAVTTIHGPVLVLAGAGSGKTRVLTRRIAHLLHEGVSPRNILAVTFTNKAAAEMRERVHELVGDASEDLWVSTFHATCARILRSDIEPLGWTRRFAIYDDDDQLRLLRQLVAAAGYDPKHVVPREILSEIDKHKNRMRGPDDVLRERRSSIADPVIRLWREYAEALKAADAVDFNDLIGMVVDLFQRFPEVLGKWRDRFRYVLVDEYQDTNRAQYLLLRLLADEHRNLAVVGDDDQSIYGFRGADVSNILNFQQDYPEAKVVRLEQNYRSTGHILDLANALVAQNSGRLEKRLWTQSDRGHRTQLVVCKDPKAEAARVVEAIHRLRRAGVGYAQIAIIYRTNALARPFETALVAARMPHKVVGGRKFYERREIRDILAYLRLVVNPADDAAFLRVVNVPPRGVGAKTQQDLRADAANRGAPLLQTARVRAPGTTAAEKGLRSFVDLISGFEDAARDAPLEELVARVIADSGYRGMLESEKVPATRGRRRAPGAEEGAVAERIDPEAQERLANLDELVATARAWDPHDGALGPFERLTTWLDGVALTGDTEETSAEGEITLMTVHSAKGLEFPVVFVVQMNEGLFPHERSGDEGIEEERRLAYVAFTRAMVRLVVTRSLVDAFDAPTQASRFLYGLPGEALDGDLPDGTPALGDREQRALDVGRTTTRLREFLAHRAARASAAEPPPRPAAGGRAPEGDTDALPRGATEAPTEQPVPAPPAPPADDVWTELEIESMDQLRAGVRVRDPSVGTGEIVRVVGRVLHVRVGDKVRRVPVSPNLRIVE